MQLSARDGGFLSFMKTASRISNHNHDDPTEPETLPNHANGVALLPGKGPLIILAILACVAFAYCALPVVLPFFLAWVAAMTLKPLVSWLRARHFPTALAALIVLVCFILG